jgi:hypothetical protein
LSVSPVIFMVARRPGVGSGSSGRAPDVVVATPPTQPVVKITNRSGEQCGEQVLDLVAGQPDQPQRGGMAGCVGSRPPRPGRRRRAWQGWSSGTRSASGGPGGGPVRPGPCWSGSALPPSSAFRRGQRHRVRGVAAVEGQLAGALVAADHEPVVVVQAQKRPVVQAVAFGARAARDLLPCPRGDLPEEVVPVFVEVEVAVPA